MIKRAPQANAADWRSANALPVDSGQCTPVGLRSSAAGAALLGFVVRELHRYGCSAMQWCLCGAAKYAIDLVLRLGLSV